MHLPNEWRFSNRTLRFYNLELDRMIFGPEVIDVLGYVHMRSVLEEEKARDHKYNGA